MVLVSRGKGQITLVDVTDSRQLMGYLTSSNQRQVIYDPTTNKYSPNYTTQNNNIIPEIYIAGNPNNQFSTVKSVKWYVQVNSIGAYVAITQSDSNYTLEANKSLTIKSNILADKISMTYKAEVVYPDPVTKLDIVIVTDIELVKISNGSQGVSGVAALVGVLDNETQVIPTDSAGNNGNFFGAEASMSIFQGTTDVTSSWTIVPTPSTGVTGSYANGVYKVTAMTTDTGYVDFVGNKTGASVVEKRFGLTKARSGAAGVPGKTPVKGTDYFDGADGQDGESSYLWIMYSQNADGSGMVSVPTNAKYIGVATTKTNSKPAVNASYTWTLVKGGDGIPGEPGADGKTSYLHIKYSDNGTTFTANGGETAGAWIGTYVDFVEADSTTFSKYTWSKVKGEDGKTPVKGTDYFDGTPGQNGESSYLWIMYSQNADGSAMVDTPTNARYIGVATTKTNNKPANNNSYTWALFKADGIKGETGADGQTSYLHVKYSDDGTTFTANAGETVGAYIGTYVDFVEADSTIFSKYTWSKVKGDDGSNATAYQLIVDKKAIKKDEKGVMTDAGKITINAISQTGTAAPVAYAGRFIIQEQSVQGSAWTTKYTSSTNQSLYVYTASATALNVKISFYLAGGTTSLIDSETVAIVSDGVTPLTLVMTTPKGEVIRNSTGSLTAKATLFKAGVEITTATYKWYEMSPAGSGDTDSGTGWNVLSTGYTGGTSGFTTNTLTITPAAIRGSATFMVIVTFEGLKYRNSVTVSDITDPYNVQVLGSTIFKNGKGTTQLTAKIYQNGVEIDPLGNSGYVYQWNYYTPAGVLVTSFSKVGKTISVSRAEVVNRADLRCQVSN